MNPKKKHQIPVVSDLEALEFARRCVKWVDDTNGESDGDTIGVPMIPADSNIGSRALSELDRLIDKGKTQ